MRVTFNRDTGQRTALDGERLRGLRRSMGLSLASVASTTGLALATISALETESVSPSSASIAKLQKIYGAALHESGAITITQAAP